MWIVVGRASQAITAGDPLFFTTLEFLRRMIIGTPITDYRDYIERCIGATERAVQATGYEHHKGALKAYRDALAKLDNHKVSGTNTDICYGGD